MGTRADFYVGRGTDAEWLGSIAWDGYPEGIAPHLFDATSAEVFRDRVQRFFMYRDDVTLPDRGWPWPWETSGTTDFAYAFDSGAVWASCFGGPWFDPRGEQPDEDDETGEAAEFPNMKDRQNVAWDSDHSGTIIVQVERPR